MLGSGTPATPASNLVQYEVWNTVPLEELLELIHLFNSSVTEKEYDKDPTE